MNLLQLKRHWIDGEPRSQRNGNTIRIKAAHCLPTSGYEHRIALWLIASFLAAYMVITEYAPDMASNPEANYLMEIAAFITMALANAFEALKDVARGAPPENLRGWLFALYSLGGAFLFLNFGPYSLFTWLTNREHVTLIIDDETVSVRHSVLRCPKRIERKAVEDVLILRNHRTGYDVMLQHEGGLLRLASVHGDLTRPTLIKHCVERALDARGSVQSETERNRFTEVETG
jgi:multisubunit Na+/H+ antiporter MnhB subunit